MSISVEFSPATVGYPPKTKRAGFYSGLPDTFYKENLNSFPAAPPRTTVNTQLPYPVTRFLPVTSSGDTTHADLCLGHGCAIGAGPVQVDENVARLGPFARANNASVFQLIHNAGGAAIAKAQAALEQ